MPQSRPPRRHGSAHPQSSHLRSRLRSGGLYSSSQSVQSVILPCRPSTKARTVALPLRGIVLPHEMAMPLALPSIFKMAVKLSTTLSTIFANMNDHRGTAGDVRLKVLIYLKSALAASRRPSKGASEEVAQGSTMDDVTATGSPVPLDGRFVPAVLAVRRRLV